MNKELREDLEHLIICNDKTITQDLRDDIKMTLDYIDKLEEENKNDYFIHMEEWARAIGNNAKLREIIDKAIEYNQKIYDTSIENERLMAKINLDILRGKIMSRQEYTEIDNYNLSEMLFNRDERLIEMIKGLREERDYIFNKLTCEKGYLQEILNKKEDRIDKAIEYIERNCLEFNVKYACQGLNSDKVDVLLDILRGEDNGSNT